MTDHSSKSGRGISRRGLLQGAAVTIGGSALAGAAASPATAAATKPFIPSGLTYSTSDPLAGFFRKVAAGTATIVTAGDSITEAFGAASPQKGYPARVRARLRNGAGQAPGGFDYVPARSQYATVDKPPTTVTYVSYTGANGAAIDLRSATYAGARSTKSGLGRRAVALTGTGVRSATFTQRCTSFVLSWRATSTRDAVSVTIDGTKVTLPAVSTGEQTWTSPKSASAVRTVTVTWQSGEPFLEGWQLFDGDEGGGFHVLEASQSTSRTEGFSLASSAANGNDTWADALRRFSPDLITSMWGTNDYGVVTPAGADAADGQLPGPGARPQPGLGVARDHAVPAGQGVDHRVGEVPRRTAAGGDHVPVREPGCRDRVLRPRCLRATVLRADRHDGQHVHVRRDPPERHRLRRHRGDPLRLPDVDARLS
ncbi:hypothetical protein Q9Q99_13370 [Curtobacterium flaccumfaciens]|nr:hypothetical protein Q9Q99_13370 [Curtobacterium flaccumfaciens]